MPNGAITGCTTWLATTGANKKRNTHSDTNTVFINNLIIVKVIIYATIIFIGSIFITFIKKYNLLTNLKLSPFDIFYKYKS